MTDHQNLLHRLELVLQLAALVQMSRLEIFWHLWSMSFSSFSVVNFYLIRLHGIFGSDTSLPSLMHTVLYLKTSIKGRYILAHLRVQIVNAILM